MQRMIFRGLFTAFTASVILSGCSSIPDESKHIPRNAGIVLGINSRQVSQKLLTTGVTMDKLFSALQQRDTSNEAIKAWKDAESSGVDLTSNFFASVVFNNKQSYATVTGGLKDAGKFEAYLKQNGGSAQKTGKDFTYAWLQKDGAIVGWTRSTVIYLLPFDMEAVKKHKMSVPGLPTPAVQDSAGDTEASFEATATAYIRPAGLISTAANEETTWAAELDRLFHLKKDESAGSIAAFQEMLKEGGDMTFFVHPELIYNNQPTMLPVNFKKLMTDCYVAGNVNFEPGKMMVNGRSYAGKELADIHKKYGNGEADLAMLEKYPSDNITGFVTLGFDLRMLGDVVKSTGADGFINLMMGQSGLTMDDVLAAFKGQIVFVSSDFKMGKQPQPYAPGDSTLKTSSKWLFSMKVGDKAAFEKVMGSAFVKNQFHKEGDQYVPNRVNGMALSINDKSVTAASDSVLLGQYQGGRGKAGLENGLAGKIKGNPLGAYISFEKIAKNIPDDQMNPKGVAASIQLRDLLKDLQVVSYPFNDKRQESEIVLNFRNTQENSLAQLLNLATAFATYYKDKRAREDSVHGPATDSAAAPQ